jgi:hypothetical protein
LVSQRSVVLVTISWEGNARNLQQHISATGGLLLHIQFIHLLARLHSRQHSYRCSDKKRHGRAPKEEGSPLGCFLSVDLFRGPLLGGRRVVAAPSPCVCSVSACGVRGGGATGLILRRDNSVSMLGDSSSSWQCTPAEAADAIIRVLLEADTQT